MWKFAGTKKDIDIKNHHTWGCPVYGLDAILKFNISVLPKYEPQSCAGIYLGHSTFHSVSVALVLNPETDHVSSQFNVVFDYEFPTVPFMGEGTIAPNWKYFFQCIL